MPDVRIVVLVLAAVVGLWACTSPSGRVARSGASAAISAPPANAPAPVEFPGLHNVVTYADGLYSGSAPEGDAGFEALVDLGVRTIISVDGATPDVDAARARGLRYVHLPIGYDGMDHDRTLAIARAVRDLPGPVYVHCHHGMHRSAGAAGAAAVSLGLLSPDAARARMVVSGTAPQYTGLYRCVAAATIAGASELDAADASFPEVHRPTGLVRTMVAVDEVMEHLRAIERSGWTPPADHPDLVPAAEAGRLADLLRTLQDDDHVRTKSPGFIDALRDGATLATTLEDGLLHDMDAAALSTRLTDLRTSCTSCHARYRD